MTVITFDTNIQTALLNSTVKKWFLVFNILPLRTLLTNFPRTSCLGLASPTRAYSPAIQFGNRNSKLLLVIRLLNELRYSLLRPTGDSTCDSKKFFYGNQLGTSQGLHFYPHAK